MFIKAATDELAEAAVRMLLAATATPEVGSVHLACRVSSVMPFGAFVEVRGGGAWGGGGGGGY